MENIPEECLDARQHEQIFKMIADNHKQVKDYIAEDFKWKKSVQPVIDAFNTVSTSGKFLSKCILLTSKLFIAIGSIIIAILALKEWFKR